MLSFELLVLSFEFCPKGILPCERDAFGMGGYLWGGAGTFFAFISLFFANYSVFNELFTFAFWTFHLANIQLSTLNSQPQNEKAKSGRYKDLDDLSQLEKQE